MTLLRFKNGPKSTFGGPDHRKIIKNRFAPFRVFSPLWAQQNGIGAIPGEKLIFSGRAVEAHQSGAGTQCNTVELEHSSVFYFIFKKGPL